MGERAYLVKDKYIRFSESDDEFGCLCTFPHNDGEHLTEDRLKSLALFGAAVRLVLEGYYDDDDVFIPNDLPEWIIEGVRALKLEMKIEERFVGSGHLSPKREREICKFAEDWGDQQYGCRKDFSVGGSLSYLCTREQGHTGPHIATGIGDIVCAIWE